MAAGVVLHRPGPALGQYIQDPRLLTAPELHPWGPADPAPDRTLPVEVLPSVFKLLFPFMPFRYAMDGMRECIGGMYGNTYWECVGVLLLFALFSVAFGMAFYRPAKKLNEMIATSKAKSEIML
jgi:hypothetical protein